MNTAQKNEKLFEQTKIGALSLKNRMVMAPMTRARADNEGLVPNQLMAEYYGQRASAGLIITEGVWPSAEGIGFLNVPGIYTEEQAAGWKEVVHAVHEKGGKIFVQLGHAGHYAHPDLIGGKLPLSPSGLNPHDNVFCAKGLTESVTPRVLSLSEIARTIGEFRHAAALAKRAGFDGVEIHGAHTFLIPSFLNSNFNKREDRYGGSPENRSRFLLEIVDALVAEWGPQKIGVKLSPLAKQGGFQPAPDTEETYRFLIQRLNDLPIAYLHLLGDIPSNDSSNEPLRRPWRSFRQDFRGPIIAAGGFTKLTGEEVLAKAEADLVAYGLPFIANPDLVERFRNNVELTAPDRTTLYAPGPEGYTDYPKARVR